MHELTLLFGVADQVGQVVRENDIDHVDAVVLDIGEATAVVPDFMYDGYSVISDEYDFLRGSELIINVIKARGVCRNCGAEFEVELNKGKCPDCGGDNWYLISGNEFVIKEVRIFEEPQ